LLFVVEIYKGEADTTVKCIFGRDFFENDRSVKGCQTSVAWTKLLKEIVSGDER
jgi:hypothetical protein